jgi:hypothetical protein
VKEAGAALWEQDPAGSFYQMKRAEKQRRTATLDELPDLSSALQECTENLNRIIDVVQAHASRVVMMTQPTLRRDDFSPAEERPIWLGSGRLAEAMSLYNETLLHVCESRGIHCIDLAARVPRSLEMFYDDAHFTELGAHFVARTLGAHLTASPRPCRMTRGPRAITMPTLAFRPPTTGPPGSGAGVRGGRPDLAGRPPPQRNMALIIPMRPRRDFAAGARP